MSVRKREWTTGSGEAREAWVVDYRDREGRRRIETFKKKKDADARAAEVAVDIITGVHVPRGAGCTVAQAGEHWISRGEADGLERSTLAAYRNLLDGHIRPYIGAAKLADLTGPGIAGFERNLYEAGISTAMRKKILGALSSLLRQAMREGYVNRNVADGHRVKTSKRGRRKLKVGKDIPSPDEIRAFLAVLSERWRPFFLVAVFTGMRASELRGLHWENVDLDAGEIHVRERADCYNEIGPPKTEAGQRTIPVGPIVINALRQHRLKSLKAGQGLVFTSKRHGVLCASTIRRHVLAPFMKKAGVVTSDGKAKYTGMHPLRHFYASWLINDPSRGGQGLPPKVIQERLGHSTMGMTMDVYGHLFPRGDDSKQLREAELALIG